MYCPKCGAQNITEAKFCRLCGTSLLPQITATQSIRVHPNYERGIRKLFMGMAFLLIAFASVFSHRFFMWWMIFPAVAMLSKGVSGLIQARQVQRFNLTQQAAIYNNAPRQSLPASDSAVRARTTGELVLPPSVTENTTKLFDRE